MLGMIVGIENAQLERRKQDLTDQIAEDRIRLREIENLILQSVSQ